MKNDKKNEKKRREIKKMEPKKKSENCLFSSQVVKCVKLCGLFDVQKKVWAFVVLMMHLDGGSICVVISQNKRR